MVTGTDSGISFRQLATVAILAALLGAPHAAHFGPAVDRPAPPLEVITLGGDTFDLAAQRGHVVIVNFWATWCPPCRGEMPLLDAFYRKHQPQGLRMLGVSVDRRRDRREVEEVMRPFGYPAGLADGAKSNGFGPPQALPITYVVDAAGTLRAALLPGKAELTEATLEAAVLSLLERSAERGPNQSRDQRPAEPVAVPAP